MDHLGAICSSAFALFILSPIALRLALAMLDNITHNHVCRIWFQRCLTDGMPKRKINFERVLKINCQIQMRIKKVELYK